MSGENPKPPRGGAQPSESAAGRRRRNREMKIDSLNHINIRTMQMEETKDWYCDVLGLEIGFRPPFDEHGYWLYTGDVAIVHLSYSEDGKPRRTVAEAMGEGLDHIGLFGTGYHDMLARLERLSIKHDKRLVGGGKIAQVFLYDPNGVLVELGYDVESEGIDIRTFEKVPA